MSGDTGSLSSLGSSSSATSISPPRHTIDQLALNMGFSSLRSSASNSSSLSATTATSSTSLINSSIIIPPLIITSSHSHPKLESIQDVSTPIENSYDIIGSVKERLITKIDPIEMSGKPTLIVIPQDTAKRAAMLLSGPKFRLNSKEILKEKLNVNNDIIYSISVSATNKKHLIIYFLH